MKAQDYLMLNARTMTEAQFQSAIITLATRLGWMHYHTHDSRRSVPGFPDLVLVHPIKRRTLFRELKAMKGRVSAAQVQWLDALASAGQDAGVWRPDMWTAIVKELSQ